MQSKKISAALRWWLTPKFPEAYIEKTLSYKPEGFLPKIRNFLRTWLVHPLKRRTAKYYVWCLKKFCGLKVVGITGSTGKTTTKEMLASILKNSGKTIYSFANIDPVFNVPTTILRCGPSTKYLILEMGVEYPGEMDFYLWLVNPDIGIITNIYPTHTVNFVNEVGVLKEKSRLARGIGREGVVVLNFENRYLRSLEKKVSAKVIWFGNEAANKDLNIRYTPDFKTNFVLQLGKNKVSVSLPILGHQFVDNAIAAASAAEALGISIEKIRQGLESFELQEHRMNVRKLKSGAILIDDTYNNNPEAAKRAVKLLKDIAGGRRSVMVFGDMLELGAKEVEYHKEIGKLMKQEGINKVIGVGSLSKYVSSNHFDNWEQAIPRVSSELGSGVILMVKGSRSINLDKLVDKLL